MDPSARRRPTRRRRASALLVTGLLGISAAAAASTGGLTTGRLGADHAAVASCDTDGVTLTWNAPLYNVAGRRYVQRTLVVSGIAPACTGRRLRITVAQTSGAAITNGNVVIAGTTANVTLAGNANIRVLTRVAVVIS